MCIHCTPGVDCAHDRSDDVWLTGADLRKASDAPTEPVSGPLAPEPPTHAPALTPHGFSEALRALGRDGGEGPTVERIDKYTVRVDGIDVVAGPETESRLRQMDAEQRRMFARIMQADR